MPGTTHVLIVEARFHENIGDMLVKGATGALNAAHVTFEHVTVPGALEIPAAIKIASERPGRKFDAYVALGCVIRGETYHFEVVSNESARGIGELTVHHALPIGNGIITAETYDQALVRANPDEKNVGAGAANAALALLGLKRQFSSIPKIT
jgi:6,7-dimethyl-8-ribityllumazine synthase